MTTVLRPLLPERQPWPVFAERFRWRQGEHVSLIGPTQCGKTTLMRALLPMRRFVAVFGTKPKDRLLDRLERDGYRRIEHWPPRVHDDRVLLWPHAGRLRRRTDVQREVFAEALDAIYDESAWCIAVDEMLYHCRVLGLGPLYEDIWSQGATLGVSLVAATQRPAGVPLMLYDQPTHLFFWRDNDEANLKRMGGMGSHDPKRIRALVAQLPHHDTLYVNTRTGEVTRTRTEP